MSTQRSEYNVTIKVSRNTGDGCSSSAELDGRYELSWSTRDAIASALEELAAELRDQEE